MVFVVIYSPRALKDLRQFDTSIRRAIYAHIEMLRLREATLDVRKLHGKHSQYRVRVGNIRVVFTSEGNVLNVLRVVDRKDAYR